MTIDGSAKPTRRPRKRDKLTLPPDLKLRVAAEAEAQGMAKATFMVQAIETAVGVARPTPRRKRKITDDKLIHALHAVAIQIKKLGTNVNQLAKQANQGMVPITPAEAQYMKNQHQLLLSAATAFFEKVSV